MNTTNKILLVGLLALGGATLSGCNSDSTTVATVTEPDEPPTGGNSASGLDISAFLNGALVEEITEEPCTLSGGTETTCYRITIAGAPAEAPIGPFCPPSIHSAASEGGIWFDGSGEVWDIDGDFIANITDIYGSGWLLHDPETGDVKITNTQASCEAAARPNVDPAYQNYCVECSIEYSGGGVAQTFLIPKVPVMMSVPSQINRDVGLTLNGVVLAPAAPVNAILSNYTIAAFDDCGGHVNPVEGYHYHGATECMETTQNEDGHASLIGVAMDGISIFAMLNATGEEDFDLDECRGHSDDDRGYHYHAASVAENMFIGCFQGEQGQVLED